MIPARIERATRTLGAPRNWDAGRDGPIGSLALRDEVFAGQASMLTAWEPTPAEIVRIAAGAPVYLRILGSSHPVVELTVGPADRETPPIAPARKP